MFELLSSKMDYTTVSEESLRSLVIEEESVICDVTCESSLLEESMICDVTLDSTVVDDVSVECDVTLDSTSNEVVLCDGTALWNLPSAPMDTCSLNSALPPPRNQSQDLQRKVRYLLRINSPANILNMRNVIRFS